MNESVGRLEASGVTRFEVAPDWQPAMREIGIDADAIFTHPQVRVWRELPDRQNGTLDATLTDGRKIRLHVKRYAACSDEKTPAELEAEGARLLAEHNIPAANLVGWGILPDRRSFTMSEDLTGYIPADKFIQTGEDFTRIESQTAQVAAQLHEAGLHHRDLYLCHFLVKPAGESVEVRLIDPQRVARLPIFFARNRWIIKDLAQFWYSTLKLPISDFQRHSWLVLYCQHRHIPTTVPVREKIEAKVRQISRHDAKLNQSQPTRNVSIPW